MKVPLSEIKKNLYKQKPIAELIKINKSGITYNATINEAEVLFFNIPITDMGHADFHSTMPAQILIRWLVY